MSEFAELALIRTSLTTDQPSMPSVTYSGDPLLIARFSAFLQQELSKACAIIATDFKSVLNSIGERLDTRKSKMDGMVKVRPPI